ncbi:Uncharacterised protein [Streptococcus pneumoniae]|nr:Uncharacterised protein [Streptococcus pneumoniae]
MLGSKVDSREERHLKEERETSYTAKHADTVLFLSSKESLLGFEFFFLSSRFFETRLVWLKDVLEGVHLFRVKRCLP